MSLKLHLKKKQLDSKIALKIQIFSPLHKLFNFPIALILY